MFEAGAKSGREREREKDIYIFFFYLQRETIERQVEVQHCMTVSVGQDRGVFAIFVCVFVFFVPRFFLHIVTCSGELWIFFNKTFDN